MNQLNEKATVVQIQEFMGVMLLREKVACDRTWAFAIERFFQFIQEKNEKDPLSFQESEINEYIDYLQSSNKNPQTIAKFIQAILAFAHYNRMAINKNNIKKVLVDKEEHPYVEEEDIYKTEEFLFQAVCEIIDRISEENGDNDEKLLQEPLEKLRDSLRNYLMFRLVVETGINADEVSELGLKHLDQDHLLHVQDRKIPLSLHTVKIIHEYKQIREKYDQLIFKQKVLKEAFANQTPNDQLQRFMEKEQKEQIAEIESLLLEQVSIEEEIHQLEEMEGQEEKVEKLENDLDNLMEKVMDMKKVIVFERRMKEYEFNQAMFVNDQYERLSDSDVIQLMEIESLPIYMLQNTTLRKWEEKEMDPKVVGHLIGSKNVSKKRNNDEMVDDFKKVVDSGFHFKDRTFSEILF